ncbi:uncharacterized protein [Saccopteryx bilineata]|uniref:uncharacterized protein n=1 Tax=Saccopteryx bilineata TaxID=59482 RepID=UPI00338DE555
MGSPCAFSPSHRLAGSPNWNSTLVPFMEATYTHNVQADLGDTVGLVPDQAIKHPHSLPLESQRYAENLPAPEPARGPSQDYSSRLASTAKGRRRRRELADSSHQPKTRRERPASERNLTEHRRQGCPSNPAPAPEHLRGPTVFNSVLHDLAFSLPRRGGTGGRERCLGVPLVLTPSASPALPQHKPRRPAPLRPLRSQELDGKPRGCGPATTRERGLGGILEVPPHARHGAGRACAVLGAGPAFRGCPWLEAGFSSGGLGRAWRLLGARSKLCLATAKVPRAGHGGVSGRLRSAHTDADCLPYQPKLMSCACCSSSLAPCEYGVSGHLGSLPLCRLNLANKV